MGQREQCLNQGLGTFADWFVLANQCVGVRKCERFTSLAQDRGQELVKHDFFQWQVAGYRALLQIDQNRAQEFRIIPVAGSMEPIGENALNFFW